MISRSGLTRAALRLRPLYWLVLATIFVADAYFNVRAGVFAADFRGTIWQAGRDILHGHSPYPPPDAAGLAHAGNPAVYPAVTVVVASPFSLLPFTASAIVWDIAAVVALFFALRIVGVLDWRVYAVVFLSFPVAASLELAQLDAPLALGCALVWRWRRKRGMLFGVGLGALLVAKIFLWPLLVWTAVTRWRQALGAVIAAAAFAAAGWSAIGFAGLSTYSHLLSSLTDAFGPRGYSLMALGTRAGLSLGVSRFLPLLAAASLCALCVSLARRGREADAFVAAVGAALLGSPILWLHYAVILLVAMAVKRPTFSPAWVVPIALWLVPSENPSTDFDFALGLSLLVLLLGVALHSKGHGALRRKGAAGTPIAGVLAVEQSLR